MAKGLFIIGIVVLVSACKYNESDTNRTAKRENRENHGGEITEIDAEFAIKAASGGLMEVELGKLAQTNAASPAVKEFGQGMYKDHSKANEELNKIALSHNIAVPVTPDDDKKRKIEDLAKLKGTEFDKAYVDFMVEDHEKDVKLFRKEAEEGNSIEMRSWARSKVSVLEHHLHMANDLKQEIEGR